MHILLSILVLIAILIPVGVALWRFIASAPVRAVFVRNVKSYFSGVLGYLFIVVFVVAASLLAFNEQFFTNNLATLDQLSAAFPMLLLFLVPAITMTAWSEERKRGTDELLFTLPASDLDILIGKYLSVLAVYTIALGFSVTNLYVLARMGNPDWGPIFTTYVGYWLAGAALLAAGLLTSALTSSATVAFVLGVVVCAVPVFIDRIPRSLFGDFEIPREFVTQLSIGSQMRAFDLGMIPLTGVLYFLSLAAFMLYLNYIAIRKRHWSGGEQTGMGVQYIVRGISVAAILFGVNILAQNGSARADLTSGGVYSLSETTRSVIAEMDPERPVTIQAYISPTVPREYVRTRKWLIGLLREYDRIGGEAIDVRIVDVEPFSKQADEAAAQGIESRSVLSIRDGRQTVEDIYMGIVFSSSYDRVVIPTLGPGSPIEYELTRSLGTVSKAERLTVGVLETGAELIGSQNDWEIIQELRLQYNVESVSPSKPIDEEKYDVLLAVMPSALPPEEMPNFVNYVEAGNPTIIFDDPYPMQLNPRRGIRVAPRLPKPSPGGMMGRRQPPKPKADGGKLTSLLNVLHISWSYDGLVWEDYNPHHNFAESVPKEYLFIRNRLENMEAISSESTITRGLQEILLAYAGEIKNVEGSPYEYTPLLVTGPVSGVLPWEEFAKQQFNPLTFRPGWVVNPAPNYEIDPYVHTVAAKIDGGENGPHVVFISDIDMISGFFFNIQLRTSQLAFDNVAFILNSIDVLADDTSYIKLRKRREAKNTLVAVEAQISEFKEQMRARQEEAEQKLEEEFQRRKEQFAKRQEKIRNNPSLSSRAREQRLQMALQHEQRRLDVFQQEQEERLEKEKDHLQDITQRKIQRTENRFRVKAVLIPPLPAVILGLGVLLVGMIRERREIDPRRSTRRR